MGTESTNLPDSMYDFHRVTICRRYDRSSGSDGCAPELVADSGGKKASESKDGIVDAKSAGVTSETNQGMSLGL